MTQTPAAPDGFEFLVVLLRATVATVHDVVNRAGMFDAQRALHDLVLHLRGICVNTPDPNDEDDD